jgi:hypothetical protein
VKNKTPYPKIRFLGIRKAGGVHAPEKGGKYRRNLEKRKTKKELKTEL